MNPNNGRYLMVGSAAVYEGPLTSLNGKACTITKLSAPRKPLAYDWGIAPRPDKHMVLARFHDDGRERVVDIRNLAPKGMNTMKNIKTTVLTAVQALLKPLDADSPKEQAVRRLGVAAELVRLGEADKKKAKTDLTKLGVITGDEQNGVVFDSPRYVVTATTKAASSRLDQSKLEAALMNEGLSGAMRTRILTAATVTNKAATSFAVETK